jgi:hypothetical protein
MKFVESNNGIMIFTESHSAIRIVIESNRLRHVRWTPVVLARVISSAKQGAPRYPRDFCQPDFDGILDRE